jgi:polyphosphate glucokinase
MGFALFDNGLPTPHLELSQHPVKTNRTYDEYVGSAALKDIGRGHWNRRVRKVIGYIDTLVTYDMLYIGGGNAKLIEPPLPERVSIVPNTAGITGGVRLWDERLADAFAEHAPFVPASEAASEPVTTGAQPGAV